MRGHKKASTFMQYDLQFYPTVQREAEACNSERERPGDLHALGIRKCCGKIKPADRLKDFIFTIL
jgi:hypothetical protein